MPRAAPVERLLALMTLIALGLPPLALAQAPAPMTDAERARRDAEKVLSFIKFHAVGARPIEPAHKPARAPAAPASARPAEALTSVKPPSALTAAAPVPVLEPAPLTPVTLAPAPTPTAMPPATGLAPLAPEPELRSEPEEDAGLQMQHFVAPVLSPALQATLGVGARPVRVRLTVEPSGRVSHAEADAGVPRRLAKPAVDAILQWQFAPLAQARTVDVDIAYRRE